MMLEGILPIRKTSGWTSNDVVIKSRRLLRLKRIGHTGTLDPDATGVLPLCLGRATRLVEYVQELPKEYEAVLRLGIATDTEDATGQVVERAETVTVTSEQVEQALRRHVGELEQVPPMYSAVKVEGRRLYELARQGLEIERASRRITVYRIDLLDARLELQYPEIRFRVSCSKGTYIRTLCVDIGRALGYPATMAELTRTAAGAIRLDQCLTLEEVERHIADGTIASRIIPMDQAIVHLPEVHMSGEDTVRALQGQQIRHVPDSPSAAQHSLVRGYGGDGAFLGVFAYDTETSMLKPVKLFLPGQ